MNPIKRIVNFLSFKKAKEKKFAESIKNITGQAPINLNLYKLAVCHTSAAKEDKLGIKNSNERLEYLGDAILGAVIAEYLFKKFPYKDEGFLTEIRSRIVNRESLNKLGKKIGLNKIVEFNPGRGGLQSHKSLYGDALEALVGAVYLDKGFKTCRKFILNVLLHPHFDINEVIENNKNFKSVLIEWAQKENRDIKFVIVKEVGSIHHKEFTAQVLIDDQPYGTGVGFSKKKAEQSAAEQTCLQLEIK
ncbi:MAG: ribonuclease III [Cytophagaceae bacterium]